MGSGGDDVTVIVCTGSTSVVNTVLEADHMLLLILHGMIIVSAVTVVIVHLHLGDDVDSDQQAGGELSATPRMAESVTNVDASSKSNKATKHKKVSKHKVTEETYPPTRITIETPTCCILPRLILPMCVV